MHNTTSLRGGELGHWMTFTTILLRLKETDLFIFCYDEYKDIG